LQCRCKMYLKQSFHNLKFDKHVKNILTICNQLSYLLKCLNGQGLPSEVKNSILFSVPWLSHAFCMPCQLGAFMTAFLIGIIDAYLCKAIRWGYNGNLEMLSELLHDADMKLFRSIHSTHCIHHPPLKLISIKLRTSHCAFALPTATITSTNIYLFCDVFLMEHINWLCCFFAPIFNYQLFSRISFFFFFFFFSFR